MHRKNLLPSILAVLDLCIILLWRLKSLHRGTKHNFSAFDLIKQLPELKKECTWLKEVNSQALQQAIQNMAIAFKKLFNGKNILRIGQFSPSSKTCSNCGTINKEVQLKDRAWTCSSCSIVLDRDVNAACNIKSFALRKILSVEPTLKNQNELPALVGVMTSEAQPISSAVGG